MKHTDQEMYSIKFYVFVQNHYLENLLHRQLFSLHHDDVFHWIPEKTISLESFFTEFILLIDVRLLE
jgi:hypothetical protein